MIDHVAKPNLSDKINCRNEKSSENAESKIKIRHFKLAFIELHSKLKQKKIDQLCKRFCKSLKVKLVFTSEKLRCAFSKKIFPRLSISLFVLAVMLVMLVGLPCIWQAE